VNKDIHLSKKDFVR